MKFVKTLKKWMKGQDLSQAKTNLAEDTRKWGNTLTLFSIASIFFTEETVLLIIGKFLELDAAPLLAVTHPWLVYLAFGVGLALRIISFVLDMNPKSKEVPSSKKSK